MYANLNYNNNKENLSRFRTIHNLNSDFPLFFSAEMAERIVHQAYRRFQNKLAFRKIRRNQFVRRKKQEYIDNLDSTEIEKKVMDFYNTLNHHTEAIMLPNYHIMTISKNIDPSLDKEKIVDILVGLKNNEDYIAEYGLFSINNVGNPELIDLNDFEFRFEQKEDLERNIELLQILDSDHLKIHKLKDIYSRSIYHKPIFNKLKKKKVLERDGETLIYLDRIDFEVFDRLPNIYPEKKSVILADEDTIKYLLS